MRRLWIVLGCLAVLLAVAALAAGLWVRSYLRSDAFRSLVAARTGQTLRAETTVEPLAWSGPSVFSQEVRASGLPRSIVETLEAQQVRAEVNFRAIFDGAWRIDRLDIQRLNATIRTNPEPAGPRDEPPPAPPKRGWLPNRFELGGIDASEANLAVDGFGRVEKTSLRLRPDGAGWLVDASGGSLAIPDRPSLAIGDCRIRFQQGHAYITQANLRLGDNGRISVSGEAGAKAFDIRADWQGVDAADLLDATWRRRLTGTVSGSAHSVAKENTAPVTTGNFLLADGVLQGVPVQATVARFTRAPQFERMPVHEVSGNFTHSAGATDVTDFVLESRGLIRVEGSCHISARGDIDGTFQVGVTSQTLRWLPGSQEKVFTELRNGYQWTPVRVGGTIDAPTEDLAPRLARALGETVIETGVDVIQQVPGNATEVIDKALDILSPLIP